MNQTHLKVARYQKSMKCMICSILKVLSFSFTSEWTKISSCLEFKGFFLCVSKCNEAQCKKNIMVSSFEPISWNLLWFQIEWKKLCASYMLCDQLLIPEIRDSHSGEDGGCSFLSCNAMWCCGWFPLFLRNVSSPSHHQSWSESGWGYEAFL
jgi:hypothetical protein